MTHAEAAVQLLQTAIANAPAVDPAFKRAMSDRVTFLEQSIRDFCEVVIDTSAELGAAQSFHKAFAALCESINFDAEARREAAEYEQFLNHLNEQTARK